MSSEDKLKQVVEIMARIAEDTTVPRNIRRAASDAKGILLGDKGDQTFKAASARMALEEISEDPNMPMHTRTMIWNALTVLEIIRE